MQYSQSYDLPFYREKFLRYLKRTDKSQETITGYGKDLLLFNRFMYGEYNGSILMEQVTKSDLQDYLAYLKEDRSYAPNSTYRQLSTLKSYYNFLVGELSFKENYASKIKHQKVYTPLPNILTKEEVEKLLEAAKNYSEYYYVLVSILYYTGSRITATVELLKENVNLKDKIIYFHKIKGGRDLYVPMHDKLVPILERFLNNHPADEFPNVFHSTRNPWKNIQAQTVRSHLTKIKEAAGIDKKIRPHILRHTTATHLTLEGVDQRIIMAILGHTDPRATTRYQQLVVENARGPLNLLP